jgi:PAS domain S-box-containing protein
MTKPPTNLPVPDLDWYREIVVAAPETIIIIDRSGKILFHNDHAEGFDPASFVGRPLFDYFLPEYHTLVREKIEKVFQTGQMDYYELATDYARSERSWYMTRLGPIIRDGNVVAISLFIRDITDLKRVEQIMGQINQDLEKRVEERTRILEEYAYRLEASEKLNAALRQARQRKEVVEKLARHSLNVLEADLGGVYLLGDGQLHSTIVLHHDAPPPETLTPGTDQGFYGILRSTEIRFLSLENPADLQVLQLFT